MTLGEVEVGGDDRAHTVRAVRVLGERGPGHGHLCREPVEPDERYGGDDLGPALREMPVSTGWL
jgi:hypothetical protein